MNDWLRLATQRSVARRALGYAVVVGAVLILINHGEAIVQGDISIVRLLRMVLTATVPHVVSTAPSAGALRDAPGQVSTQRSRESDGEA